MKASAPCALALAAALMLGGADSARAFLGFADTSLVTVVADPAETANWAAELERLSAQVAAATNTLRQVETLRAYAGNPSLAANSVPAFGQLASQVSALAAGSQTSADVAGLWQSLGPSGRAAQASDLLDRSGAAVTMQVFGREQARNLTLYQTQARESFSGTQVHQQVAAEQAARVSIAASLEQAWEQFRASTTESGKQAVLSEISQLQAQSQLMESRRRALLDDLDWTGRQQNASESARSKAQDEALLAESALLGQSASARAGSSESQRMATLQKAPSNGPAADYSALRVWTTADTGTGP